MYRHSKDWEKSTSEILSSIANFLALSGLVNMSFFLIPVSKHSPVLVAFNLPMEQSLYVHQLAGLTSIVFYVLHGVLHMIRFVTERGDEDSSSAPRLWRLLFPPVGCWCADYEVDVETSECISCCSGIEGETKKGVETSCYYLWRNFTGLASAFFAVAIFFTSRQKMRRHSYRIFYICHVIFAPLMFLFAIWHWQRTYVFLLPSLTIHCIGFFVVHFSPTQAGVQVISVERIGGTDFYEMVVQCLNLDRYGGFVGGEFIRVKVVGVSRIAWHPFSVFSVDRGSNTLKVLFKSCKSKDLKNPIKDLKNPIPSPWLRGLISSVSNDDCVVLDGFYGPRDRVELALDSPLVVMIAGGSGITPIHAILEGVLRSLETGAPSNLKQLDLIFVSRDKDFNNYISMHVNKLMVAFEMSEMVSSELRMNVRIYDTSEKVLEEDSDHHQVRCCEERSDESNEEKRYLSSVVQAAMKAIKRSDIYQASYKR